MYVVACSALSALKGSYRLVPKDWANEATLQTLLNTISRVTGTGADHGGFTDRVHTAKAMHTQASECRQRYNLVFYTVVYRVELHSL